MVDGSVLTGQKGDLEELAPNPYQLSSLQIITLLVENSIVSTKE